MRSARPRPRAVGALRCGPWRATPSVALLAPVDGRPVTRSSVHDWMKRLEDEGVHTVLTAALGPRDQAPFLEAGFTVRERLHLLAHDLTGLERPSWRSLRRARSSDRPAVLALDRAAFPDFWQLDEVGLREAIAATPAARFRVAGPAGAGWRSLGGGAPGGYAITGRAGARGYLQRLAVRPELQRAGLGTSLVLDGLRWARRWGAQEVLVNTQVGNDGAVRLYERLGFRQRPEGLAVLDRPLGGGG